MPFVTRVDASHFSAHSPDPYGFRPSETGKRTSDVSYVSYRKNIPNEVVEVRATNLSKFTSVEEAIPHAFSVNAELTQHYSPFTTRKVETYKSVVVQLDAGECTDRKVKAGDLLMLLGYDANGQVIWRAWDNTQDLHSTTSSSWPVHVTGHPSLEDGDYRKVPGYKKLLGENEIFVQRYDKTPPTPRLEGFGVRVVDDVQGPRKTKVYITSAKQNLGVKCKVHLVANSTMGSRDSEGFYVRARHTREELEGKELHVTFWDENGQGCQAEFVIDYGAPGNLRLTDGPFVKVRTEDGEISEVPLENYDAYAKDNGYRRSGMRIWLDTLMNRNVL